MKSSVLALEFFASIIYDNLNVILAPLVRALEIATEKSSFDQNLLQPSISAPAPEQASGILGFQVK